MKKELLVGKHITKRFGKAEEAILKDVDITLYEGDFTIIMGASGAGKSTLLYALSGMNTIDEGEILFQGQDIANLHELQMATLRAAAFGFVFQQTHLVSNLSLLENVAVAGYLHPTRNSRESLERASKLLESMHVEQAMHRFPARVSGGEAQRAALACAIINEPSLIFADEPTGALNRKNSDEVLKILEELHQKGQSILMVTHDMRAASYGNRILYLEDGRLLDKLQLSEDASREEKEEIVGQWLTSRMW